MHVSVDGTNLLTAWPRAAPCIACTAHTPCCLPRRVGGAFWQHKKVCRPTGRSVFVTCVLNVQSWLAAEQFAAVFPRGFVAVYTEAWSLGTALNKSNHSLLGIDCCTAPYPQASTHSMFCSSCIAGLSALGSAFMLVVCLSWTAVQYSPGYGHCFGYGYWVVSQVLAALVFGPADPGCVAWLCTKTCKM
jgi:hypothetical protein